ncbi:MAG: hypothetical protein PHU25_14525 [Deltaproteobacteria bacterium]|nr:hypothetical protein [Deltaproteobacteria bacterium]
MKTAAQILFVIVMTLATGVARAEEESQPTGDTSSSGYTVLHLD